MRPPLAIIAALLVLAACAPTAHAYRYEGPRWPGSTITYYNATGYRTAVSAAVRTWNASGVALRLRAVSRRNARVLITGGYGRGCRGVARVGFFRSSRAVRQARQRLRARVVDDGVGRSDSVMSSVSATTTAAAP